MDATAASSARCQYFWEHSGSSPPYNPEIHIAIILGIIKQTEHGFNRKEGGDYKRDPIKMMEIFRNFLTEEESNDRHQICGGWDHYSEEGENALDSTRLIKYAGAKKFRFPTVGLVEVMDERHEEAIHERKSIGLDDDTTELLRKFLIDIHVCCNCRVPRKWTWSRLRKIISHYIFLFKEMLSDEQTDTAEMIRILYTMIDGNVLDIESPEGGYKSFSRLCSSFTDKILISVFPEFISKIEQGWMTTEGVVQKERKKDNSHLAKDCLKSVIDSLDGIKDRIPEEKYLDMIKKLHIAHAYSS